MSGATDYDVSVVVVTYHSADDIEASLRGIRTARRSQIVVIDNASTDETPEVLERLREEGLIDVLVLGTDNPGFAKAVNRGIALSSGRNVFLLNPDAVMDGAALDRMVELCDADRTIGIAAPVVTSGPTVDVMVAGKQPRLWPVLMHQTGLARAFPHVRALRGRHLFLSHHASRMQDVEWVSGCCLLIAGRALRELGPLSERWFMYGEDIEYCQRALDHGFRVVVTPDATATHMIGSSVRKSGKAVSTLWARNTYDYYVTQFKPGVIARFLWRLVFSGGLGSRAMLLLVKARRNPEWRDEYHGRAQRFAAHALAVWRHS